MISATSAPEVSAWSEDLGGGVVRQTVVTPHPRAMDGSAPAIDLSHGQRPAVGLRRAVATAAQAECISCWAYQCYTNVTLMFSSAGQQR